MGQGKCGWARRRKWRYLDGTLPAPQKRQVEAHLQVCIPCRADFTLAQDALNALSAGKPLTPEQQRALQRPKPALTPSRAAAVAILALLLGAGVYLWRVQGDALLERLTARGDTPRAAAVAESAVAESSPAPSEPEPAMRPEPAPIEPPAVEPKPAEAAPKPVEAPPPAASPTPPRRPATAPTRPAPPKRASQPPKQPAQPATPPEGTVEVYDAEGNLIQRKQLQEKR
jgi:hypothetical protein